MLLKIIVGILATIGAVVVIGIAAVIVLYFVVARRITTRVRQSLREFESLNRGSIDADDVRHFDDDVHFAVPPMRIQVRQAMKKIWNGESGVEECAKWIGLNGFELIGDFLINELPESRLKVFISVDSLLVAVIRQDDDATNPYVEFCFDLGDNRRGGVSNPPRSTIPLPDDAIGEHFDEDFYDGVHILPKMLQRARDLAVANGAIKVDRKRIAKFFESAHAAEMDARIERGGLTVEEIRAVLGEDQESLSEAEVEKIQWDWQESIEDFLVDLSLKSADETGELLAVYDGSLGSYLQERICDFYAMESNLEPRQLVRIKDELESLLQLFQPREAVARLRPLLPESLRFSLVDQLRKPVEADVYILPFAE